jgi:HPt (histidine-containing phosphotransfer) domain-containing protein
MTATDTATPVDWSRIEAASDGDQEFAAELIQVFVESANQTLDEIKEALAANDLATVGKAAHSLKGASASVGANIVRSISSELEEKSKDNNAGASSLLFETLRVEVPRAISFMHDQLNVKAA